MLCLPAVVGVFSVEITFPVTSVIVNTEEVAFLANSKSTVDAPEKGLGEFCAKAKPFSSNSLTPVTFTVNLYPIS
jgi:hypothetical protein